MVLDTFTSSHLIKSHKFEGKHYQYFVRGKVSFSEYTQIHKNSNKNSAIATVSVRQDG